MGSNGESSAAASLTSTLKTVTLVTIVAGLIWLWAEAEGLRTATVTARVQFVAPADDYVVRIVSPDWRGDAVSLRVEGPAISIDEVERLLRASVDLVPGVGAVPGEPGEHQVRLLDAMRAYSEFKRVGVTVIDVSPAVVTVRVSKLVTRELPLVPDLRGIEVEGAPTVRPERVRVRAPEQAWAKLGERGTVGGGAGGAVASALIGDDERRALTEDGPQTVPARVVVPEVLLGDGPVTVEPESARVTLRVRRQTDEEVVATVPVWITMPHTEGKDWDVEILDGIIRNVVVRGPTELIARVRSRELLPIAFVMLSSDDLEEPVTSKQAVFAPVWATLLDRGGGVQDPLQAQLDSALQEEVAPLRFSAENRRVGLRITRRGSGASQPAPAAPGPIPPGGP